jgi:hypothetical protein
LGRVRDLQAKRGRGVTESDRERLHLLTS